MSSDAASQLSKDDVDTHYMQLAIAQANLCTPTPAAYSVGAILVQHTATATTSLLPHTAPLTERIGERYRVVATGYSRELGEKTHAEEVALVKYNQLTSPDTTSLTSPPHALPPLVGHFTLYTTMEPCSVRLSGRTSCTAHVLVSHVQRVVVGVEEPKVFVSDCQGMRLLREGGVEVRRLEGIEEQCLAMNQHLLTGPTQ